MLIIGSHVGFKKDTQLLGALDETLSYNGNAFMFYTGAPQNTVRMPLNDDLTFKALEKMKENNISLDNVVVHAPYIINLANNKDLDKYNFSINFLKQECNRCTNLFVKKLVLHPGSHVGCGNDIGINNIINALNEVLKESDTTILLETMAGKGTEVGKTLEEIKQIIDGVIYKDKIGICLDTCHLSDAGYDVSKFDEILDILESYNLLDKVLCVHVNDSKNICGSHKDRHAKIGEGNIGLEAITRIINHPKLKHLPFLLETPNELDGYAKEIKLLKSIYNG